MRFLKNAFNTVRLLINFVILARDPERSDIVKSFVERMYDLGLFRESVRHLRSKPQTDAALDRRRRLPHIDLDSFLHTYPEGSVGNTFARTMLAAQLDPNYFRRGKVPDDALYIEEHISETHDLWHLVTGFDTSVAGELGLQAFMLRQLRVPQSFIFISGGFIRALLKDPTLIEPMMNEILRGWKMAAEYPSLICMDWMAVMGLSLDDVRTSLGKGGFPVCQPEIQNEAMKSM